MNRPTRRALQFVGVGASVALLGGCSSLQDAIGLGKSPPDEFAVVKKAPLVIPPEYTLRPPRPGAPRPQELQPTQSARMALLGTSEGGEAAQSEGEVLLLQNANVDQADPTIRAVLNEESGKVRTKDQAFADQVIFYEPVGTASAVPVGDVQSRALDEPGQADSEAEIGEEKKGGFFKRIGGIF